MTIFKSRNRTQFFTGQSYAIHSSDKLINTKIEWKRKKCMTIVLCAKGYPRRYKKNLVIKNIDKLKLSKQDYIFHAGTKIVDNELRSNGGRVLNITSVGNSFLKIRKNIINNLKKLNWKKGFYRKDIGWRVINKNESY